ncbi:MAG: tRNA pseudouridine(55) synthase TruB [Patescibacteria group bacterium]
MADGFLLVNKPPGPTSHDVVEELRLLTKIREIGHAGTLDPLAEGLLILLLGNFTKKSQDFMKFSKEYRATMRLGLESDSHDVEGEITLKKEFAIPLREDIESALEKFRGKIKQVPPQFSAVKVRGRKAYEEARKGKRVELEARQVTISKLETVWYKFPLLTLDIACSSGTYIRSLARDIGDSLDTGAIVIGLKRVSIGPYHIKDAVELSKITSKNWVEFLKS